MQMPKKQRSTVTKGWVQHTSVSIFCWNQIEISALASDNIYLTNFCLALHCKLIGSWCLRISHWNWLAVLFASLFNVFSIQIYNIRTKMWQVFIFIYIRLDYIGLRLCRHFVAYTCKFGHIFAHLNDEKLKKNDWRLLFLRCLKNLKYHSK